MKSGVEKIVTHCDMWQVLHCTAIRNRLTPVVNSVLEKQWGMSWFTTQCAAWAAWLNVRRLELLRNVPCGLLIGHRSHGGRYKEENKSDRNVMSMYVEGLKLVEWKIAVVFSSLPGTFYVPGSSSAGVSNKGFWSLRSKNSSSCSSINSLVSAAAALVVKNVQIIASAGQIFNIVVSNV